MSGPRQPALLGRSSGPPLSSTPSSPYCRVCFEGKEKRAVSGAPTLWEVFQVKLDDKFQEKVEGKRKYDKRADKAAAKVGICK